MVMPTPRSKVLREKWLGCMVGLWQDGLLSPEDWCEGEAGKSRGHRSNENDLLDTYALELRAGNDTLDRNADAVTIGF